MLAELGFNEAERLQALITSGVRMPQAMVEDLNDDDAWMRRSQSSMGLSPEFAVSFKKLIND